MPCPFVLLPDNERYCHHVYISKLSVCVCVCICALMVDVLVTVDMCGEVAFIFLLSSYFHIGTFLLCPQHSDPRGPGQASISFEPLY